MSLTGPKPQAVPKPDALAEILGSDEVARYAVACRPIYEHLRRIIGQVSGLTILIQLTSRHDVLDLKELKNCKGRLVQTEENLAALNAPAGTTQHKSQLEAAYHFSRLAVRTLSTINCSAPLEEKLTLSGLQIKRAYAHLQAASADNAGLEMVDFSQACCCCGK